MPEPIAQAPQQNLTPDEAKAALGLGNMFLGQMMPQATEEEPTEAPQEPETAPEQTEPTEPEETAVAEEKPPQEENQEFQKLTKDFDEFKGKIEGVIDTKFNDLTKNLKDALAE